MRRRWYQFSLRALLLGFFVLGSSLALWRWLVEPYREQQATMVAIVEAGGTYETQPGPRWLRALVGDAWCQDVTSVDLFSTARVPERLWDRLLRLPTLRSIRFDGQESGNEHLKPLYSLRSLEELIVRRPTREAVDAFEKARPDVSLRVEMWAPELWPAAVAPYLHVVPCDLRSFPKGWGPALVPESARRWAGKVVRVVGNWSTIVDENAGVIELCLFQPWDQYYTRYFQPWNVVTVHFRVPNDARRVQEQGRWLFLDGVLSVPELGSTAPAVYSLHDAVIVRYLPRD